MSMLEGFRNKDFLEQITLLNDIATSRPAAALPDILALFADPFGDASIDSMVVIALNALLADNEAFTVRGLAEKDARLRTLCIRTAGEHRFRSAVAPLADLALDAEDPELVLELLSALARIAAPESLPAFQKHLDSTDSLILSLSIEMSGFFRDETALPRLMDVVEQSLAEDKFQTCDVTTWKAIQALGDLATDEAIFFLAEKLHHKNPIARRLITDVMVDLGEAALEPLLGILQAQDEDERILAANVLGFIGSRRGADGLVDALDRGLADAPNVRYAFYEALGRIGTMKGVICLMDGLGETDELLLMAVVGGLERHVNPGMLKTVSTILAGEETQAEAVANAIVASRAMTLFRALYQEQAVAQKLMAALAKSRDTEICAAFQAVLEDIRSPEAAADLKRLWAAQPNPEPGRKALAVDDSRSMLALHRAILTDLGFEAGLASDGQEALEFLRENGPVALIVTDMNMPVMDGMELVEQLRQNPDHAQTPIVMVTTEKEASQKNLAETAGVSAFITKPFRPEQLKAMIASLLAL